VSTPPPGVPLLQPRFARWRYLALTIGLAGLVACALMAHTQPVAAMRSYWAAWLYCLGLSLGALSLLMVHTLTGGRWGEALRPLLRAALRPLPLLALLLVPVAFGLPRLFAWAAVPAARAGAYLNRPFFLARAVIYLLTWLVLAALLRRRACAGTAVSAAGLLLYAFTMSFATVDWFVSLQPQWSTTAAGLIVIAAQALGALSFAVLVACGARPRPQAAIRNDLGTLLFVCMLLWAYVAYAQFLTVWGGDLPRESRWYLARMVPGWRGLTFLLVAARFALPFGLLLFRRVKRSVGALPVIAAVLLATNWLYTLWLVAPSVAGAAPGLRWLDVAAVAGIGGLWTFFFAGAPGAGA